MKTTWRVVWIMGIAAVVAFLGCGRSKRASETKASGRAAATPLPEWAPKNPSPEFMRAWKVLKPTPDDAFTQFAEADPAKLMLVKRVSRTWSAAYEFFGTLTDEQMRQFFSTREIRMPVKSLTAGQRAALDHWFERWRVVMRGNVSVPEDWLVVLYKMGAREDLSNADVGFTAQNEGRRVHIIFWVGEGSSFRTDFANM